MFDLWTRKKFPAYGRFVESRLKAKFTDPLGITLLLGVFTVFVVKSLAIENATLVKSASADQFMVSFTGSTGQPQQLALNLLGTTSRYTYFYDPSKNQSIIIPVENVALMQKFSSSIQAVEVKKQ